jgi:hypothetical protein
VKAVLEKTMEGSMAISPWQDIWLVVFRPTPLKNDGVKVSWDDDIPNNMEKTCSKPPTRVFLDHGRPRIKFHPHLLGLPAWPLISIRQIPRFMDTE